MAATCPPDEIAAKIGPAASEVVKLLPELSPLLPDVAPSPHLEPEQEKRRLFEALCAMMLRCAESGPLLLIFEDIHWCDDVGLEFLLHLARRARGCPLLIAVTYRSDEVTPGLRHLLAGLDRERLATEIRLDCLDVEHVAEMQDRMPQAELVVFEQGSHLHFFDERERYMAVVNAFLDRVENAAGAV